MVLPQPCFMAVRYGQMMKRHESRLVNRNGLLFEKSRRSDEDWQCNSDVREALRLEEVIEKVKGKQRAWKEKLEQMKDVRLVKVCTEEIAGERPRGRPRKK